MCEYCQECKTIMSANTYSVEVAAFKLDKDQAEAFEYPMGVYIDRGYLRLVDLQDCNCMDHGERVKINFCPFCGGKIETD